MQSKVDKREHNQALMEALRFDDDDLDANHNGYLSKKQRHKLSGFRRNWKISIVFIIVIAVFGIILAILDGYRIQDTFSSRLGICGVIILIAGAFSFRAYSKIQAFNNDLSKGDVLRISGIVTKYDFANRGEIGVRISGLIFRAHEDRFHIFHFGEYYTIYYTPFSKYLLSGRLPSEPTTPPENPKIMRANPPII